MTVTLLVSKLLKLREVRLLQPENILLMSVTLLVIKPLTSREVRLLQPSNILLMLVTPVVLRLLKSAEVIFSNPLNKFIPLKIDAPDAATADLTSCFCSSDRSNPLSSI